MKDAFKKIAKNEQVPDELKVRVMDSVNTAKVFIDLAELFTGRYVETFGNLFRTDGHGSKTKS